MILGKTIISPFTPQGEEDLSSYWATRYPSALTAVSNGATTIALGWTNNGDADYTGHKVYISTDNVTFTLKATIESIGTTYTATELTEGTLYYFYVKAYKGTSESAASNTDSDTARSYSSKIAATQAANLLVHLPLNDTSGTAAQDATANNYDGTYYNTPTLGVDGIGDGLTAITVDGTNEFLKITAAAFAAAFGKDEGTVMFWAKIDASILQDGSGHYIAWLAGGTATNNILIYKSTTNNNIVFIRTANSVARLYTHLTADSNWAHLAFTWSYIKNQIRAYINGVKCYGAFPGGIEQFVGDYDNTRMAFGATYIPSSPFKGSMAHIAAWTIPLTQGEIYALSAINRKDNTAHSLFTRLTSKSLWRGTGTTDWLGRPSMCKNGATWVVVYRQSGDHNTADANCAHHIRFSADEGATWTDADTFTDSNPVTNAPFTMQSTNTNQPGCQLIPAPNGDLILHIYETGGAAPGSYQWRSTDDGATWSVEGRVLNSANYICEEDYVVVGTDIYIVARDITDGAGNEDTVLIKSTDNGTNWAIVSDIENAIDANETGITRTTGNNMIAIARSSDMAHTYLYRSTDLGVTWGAREDVTAIFGVFQKPKLRYVDGKVFAIGRDYQGSSEMYSALYVSSDGGVTWSSKFLLELPGDYQDAGYGDMLQRTGGVYYALGYGGTTGTADIKEYTFEDV